MSDPDPRFTLANERTYLAWVRTALGFVVGAAAVQAVDLPWPSAAVVVLCCVLGATGVLCVVLAWWRWRQVEEAIAAGTEVRMGHEHLALAIAVAVVAVAIVALALF